MSLWAILAAPLLAGNDLSQMTPDTLAILTNKDVIAIDQDTLGKQGTRLSQEGPQEIWTKQLAGGAMAVGLFNRSTEPQQMTLSLAAIKMDPSAKLHDIWGNQDVTATDGSYATSVPAHGVVLLRVSQ